MCTCTVLKAGHLSAIVQVLLPGLGCLSKLGLPLLHDPIHNTIRASVLHAHRLPYTCMYLAVCFEYGSDKLVQSGP